jgi:hypothetical protein
MTTIKDLLTDYNERAARAGIPTLKAWKGTKEKLAAKIAELGGAELTIADIAAELKMTPKVVRGTLRRKGLKAVDGHWPTVKRGTGKHCRIVNLLKDEGTDDAR